MATEISDWNDLDAAIQGTNGSNETGDFVLVNDLDKDTAGYDGIGNNWQPCGKNATGNSASGFHGTFDGNGFEIRDLRIDNDSHDPTRDQIGLFGSTYGNQGNVIIENLGVVGKIISIDPNDDSIFYVGMLVGILREDQIVRDCYAKGTLYCPTGNNAGGFVGNNFNSTIKNSYSSVDVFSATRVGGFVGKNISDIENSYSTGFVEIVGQTYDGEGFVGDSSGSEIDCYYNTETSGTSSTQGNATGLTTSEMQGSGASNSGNMDGLNYTNKYQTVDSTEKFTEADGYPVLQDNSRRSQCILQGVAATEKLSGQIQQSSSGVSNAFIFGHTVPSGIDCVPTDTDSNGNYTLSVPEDGSTPFEVAVGVDFDDGTDRFGRAKTILFDP